MYRDSVDALTCLLLGVDHDGEPLERSEVLSITSTTVIRANGIRQCTVQVVFSNGKAYRIEAFGEEANDLHHHAKSHPMYSMITV
jgi:hypothetical protein